MIRYIAKRLGISLLILFLGSILMFVLTINSGDPLADLRESNAPNRENLMRQRITAMRLEDTWYERYWSWLKGLITQGDLGKDIQGRSVNDLVASAAGATLRLVILATLLAIVVVILLLPLLPAINKKRKDAFTE